MTTRRLSLLLLLAFLAACGAGLTDSAAGVATQRLTASASGVSATFMRQDNPSAVIGAGSRAEIWDAAAWQRYLDEQESAFAEIEEEVIPGMF